MATNTKRVTATEMNALRQTARKTVLDQSQNETIKELMNLKETAIETDHWKIDKNVYYKKAGHRGRPKRAWIGGIRRPISERITWLALRQPN